MDTGVCVCECLLLKWCAQIPTGILCVLFRTYTFHIAHVTKRYEAQINVFYESIYVYVW